MFDYCENGSLADLLKKQGNLNEVACRVYTAQLVSALDHIHSQGVIHHDLRPSNILIDADYNLRIANFEQSVQARTEIVDEPKEDLILR